MFARRIQKIKEDLLYPEMRELQGNILEIGFGRGNDFAFYNHPEVSLYGADVRNEKDALENARKFPFRNVTLRRTPAEELPFADSFFDGVVISFALCSVADPEKVLAETKRVMKKGATILVLEHLPPVNRFVSRLQKIISPLHAFFCRNCHLNRDPTALLGKTFALEKKIMTICFNQILFLRGKK